MAKRTLAQLRGFINQKNAEEAAVLQAPGGTRPRQTKTDGSMIDGTSLARAMKKLELVPSPEDRDIIRKTLESFPKYQALGILLSESGQWFKKYPELMEDLAGEATALDTETIRIR